MRVGTRSLARALQPQLVAQALLIGAVLVFPQITRWTRPAEASAAPSPGSDEAERLMQEAIRGQQQHERAAPPEPH